MSKIIIIDEYVVSVFVQDTWANKGLMGEGSGMPIN
jgi:hypothetical protein